MTNCNMLCILSSEDAGVQYIENWGLLYQVKYMMGLKVPRYNSLQATIQNLAENLSVFSWREYIVSLPSLAHATHSTNSNSCK